MSFMESFLTIVGLSTNVFLVAQYEGTMLRSIRWKMMLVICLIFFVFQSGAMAGGYWLTKVPFFVNSSSEDLKKLCFFLASVLFLIVAAMMLYKAFRPEIVEERAREIVVGRVLLEALSAAFFTFLAGIGWGFIGRNIFAATLILSFATVAAVIAGVYTGVHEGCRFRHGILAIGGYSLMTVGIVILARYL